MYPEKVTLFDIEGLAAVDTVARTGLVHEVDADELIAICTITESGGATSVDIRTAIEGSIDGSYWFELIRFDDMQTLAATVIRIARIVSGAVADTEKVAVATDLEGTADTSGTVGEGPIPRYLRAKVHFEASGGGTPDDDVKIEIAVRNRGGNL